MPGIRLLAFVPILALLFSLGMSSVTGQEEEDPSEGPASGAAICGVPPGELVIPAKGPLPPPDSDVPPGPPTAYVVEQVIFAPPGATLIGWDPAVAVATPCPDVVTTVDFSDGTQVAIEGGVVSIEEDGPGRYVARYATEP